MRWPPAQAGCLLGTGRRAGAGGAVGFLRSARTSDLGGQHLGLGIGCYTELAPEGLQLLYWRARRVVRRAGARIKVR